MNLDWCKRWTRLDTLPTTRATDASYALVSHCTSATRATDVASSPKLRYSLLLPVH